MFYFSVTDLIRFNKSSRGNSHRTRYDGYFYLHKKPTTQLSEVGLQV